MDWRELSQRLAETFHNGWLADPLRGCSADRPATCARIRRLSQARFKRDHDLAESTPRFRRDERGTYAAV